VCVCVCLCACVCVCRGAAGRTSLDTTLVTAMSSPSDETDCRGTRRTEVRP
jgi:hypothetical protein